MVNLGPPNSKRGRPPGRTGSGLQKPGSIPDFPFNLSEIITAPGEDEEQGYVPLPLEQLATERGTTFDIYLKGKLKDSPQPSFFLCCPRGQVFPGEWREKLQQAGISRVYFAAADVPTAIDYLQGRLEETLESPHRSTLEKAILTYDVLQLWTRKFFNSDLARAEEQVDLSLKFIDGLLHLARKEDSNMGFVFEIRGHDFDLYTHCLNVCLLSLAFVSFLRWDQQKASAFGLGALLHDIGITEISPGVLRKKAPLTLDERERIERHPNQGFKILKNFGTISHEALMMVLQHHENGDGSGYPQKLRLDAIHPWARILRIVDTYEAMTSDRPWRPARPPRETLWSMRDDWEKSQIYDPVYLKAFIKFLAGQ